MGLLPFSQVGSDVLVLVKLELETEVENLG